MIADDDLSYYEDLLDMLDSPLDIEIPNIDCDQNNNYSTTLFMDDSSDESENSFPQSNASIIVAAASSATGTNGFIRTANAFQSSIKTQLLLDTAASKYANFYASSFNQQDPNELMRCFSTICTPEAQVILNIYNLESTAANGRRSRNPLNHFGNFTRAELSLEQFVTMLAASWELIPDGCLEIVSSRTCSTEEDTSLDISCFRKTGTIISKDSVLGVGDKKGRLRELRQPRTDVLQLSALQYYYHKYLAEGSIIMYRNKDGRITGIEYYYQFSN